MYQDYVEYPIIPTKIDLQSLVGLLEIPEIKWEEQTATHVTSLV